MQQCVYQTKFKNVCEVKKQLVQPRLVWSKTLLILLSMNACVRMMDQHFEHFYCRPWKNGQLDEMSATV